MTPESLESIAKRVREAEEMANKYGKTIKPEEILRTPQTREVASKAISPGKIVNIFGVKINPPPKP